MAPKISEEEFFKRLGLVGNPFSRKYLENKTVYYELIDLNIDGFKDIFRKYTSSINQQRTDSDLPRHMVLIYGYAKSGKTTLVNALKEWIREEDNKLGIKRHIFSVDCTISLMGDDFQIDRLFNLYDEIFSEMIKRKISVKPLDLILLKEKLSIITQQAKRTFRQISFPHRPLVILENFADSQSSNQTNRLLNYLADSFSILSAITFITSNDSNVKNDFERLTSLTSHQLFEDPFQIEQIDQNEAEKITQERISKCKYKNNTLKVKYRLVPISEIVDLFFRINPSKKVTVGILSSRLCDAFNRKSQACSQSPPHHDSIISFTTEDLKA